MSRKQQAGVASAEVSSLVDPVSLNVSTNLGDTDMAVLSNVETCSSLSSGVGAIPVSSNRKLIFHSAVNHFH